ncbi:MAG: orotidine-5'-phosphate decarboxylase [Actinobacteria bacterium]|nr:orotidine-5'-phosphate decarboxylase [Actinomycetota bacterium]
MNPLIVALDTADLGRLSDLAGAVGPSAGHLKVGLQAFGAHGPAAVEAAAAHAPVFCDLKLHDIPTTVAGAAAAIAGLGVGMLTVHASGGPDMVAAAVRAAPRVRVLAVTVLTSLDDRALARVGQPAAGLQVPRLARLALDAGAGGLVCAPTDVAAVRSAVGPDVVLVVPGVRPAGTGADDQARVATPAEALRAGADHLVVGRPVTAAADPGAAARALAAELGASGRPARA